MKPYAHTTSKLVSISLIAIMALVAPGGKIAEAHANGASAFGPADPFPARAANALTGSEFLARTSTMNAAEREQAIMAEITAGNVPDHIRALVPVELSYGEHRATIFVVPDYLAIGANEDYVIIPMMPRTAMHIAREFGYTLPTRKMVDDIHHGSSVQLTPVPMHPGGGMTSNAYYEEHDCRIKLQLPPQSGEPALIAGHKKDVVLTPRLLRQPDRVAIYGWHYPSGRRIQPLSLVHEVDYVDYSHGARLISRLAIVDGEPVDLAMVFGDKQLSPLVSDEGAVPIQSYL